MVASHLGLTAHDGRLDDLSESAFTRRRRKTGAWLAGFRALDDAALTPDERIDRALVISVLRGREILADWEMWRRQPDTYLNVTLGSVFTLLLHRLRPEPELVPAVVARLRGTPAVLETGTRNLVPELTPRIFVDRALGQARAGARYARDLVAREVTDAGRRAEVAAAGAVAASAFDDFAIFLESLAPRARGEWAIGERRYTALLREKELLTVDARALRERGRREYERIAGELRRCARTAGAGDDWPAVLARLNLDHPPTPETMRDAYAEWTTRARSFLLERGLVSLPAGEECRVEPSPVFQRPALAVASYASPPAFSTSRQGHFFVPFPPDGVPAEEVQRRLEANSYAGIPTTAVHEAYPGHHWHLVTANQHASALRRVFRTPYFSEGWALYAEQMMREQGFFTDWRHELAQHEATIFRAARIVVDTSLHIGEMTHAEAVTFMEEKANLPTPTAKAEVTRYCAWPTQASAYLTGCLEILAMRDRYLARTPRAGTAALREFHDRLAATGALPLPLAERALGEP
ncbi:MAG TPA: DUF885 domain-containing protein [Methylomirabilota bacterium]